MDPNSEPSLTQDCVVEWNESKHTSIDLRKLADPSFQTQGSMGGLETPFRSATSSNRRRRSSVASSNDERSLSPVPQRRRLRRRRAIVLEAPLDYHGSNESLNQDLEHRNHRPPLAHLSTTSTGMTTNNPNIPAVQHQRLNPEGKNHHFADLLRIIQQSDAAVDPNGAGELENPSPSVPRNETAPKGLPVELSFTTIPTTNGRMNDISFTAPAAKEEDDEFGDIHFTTEELAVMDSMVVRVHHQEPSTDNFTTTTGNRPHISTVQPAAAERIVRPTPSANKRDETDDPFGDDDFTDVDIDALLRAAANTENKSQQRQVPRSLTDPFSDLSDVELLDALLSTHPTVPPKPNEAAEKEDEFPDIDLEALDRLIIAQTKPDHAPPPEHAAIRNPRRQRAPSDPRSYLTFSRYKILQLHEDTSTFTKTATLARWTLEMLKEEEQVTRTMHHPSDPKRPFHDDLPPKQWTRAGAIHLRGEWYHTPLQEGVIIHIVSLTGNFQTDTLPLTLHTCPPSGSDTEDDLVLVVHPDLLLTPTIISETVSCTRRAILKSRLGTTGLTCTCPQFLPAQLFPHSDTSVLTTSVLDSKAKAALFGTMRHALFEETMRAKDFTVATATHHIQTIVRQNAEGLLACKTSSRDAEQELMRFLPQLQRFANEYTEFGGGQKNQATLLEPHRGNAAPTTFVAKSAEAIEEPIISPELGLKGNVDMLVKAVISSSGGSSMRRNDQPTSILGIELKTCHHQQPQNIHITQLALYVVMLHGRYGTQGLTPGNDGIVSAADSGLLLYINNEAIRAVPVAPVLSEIKSLIGMRNLVAIESVRSTRPRGVELSYEASKEASHTTK
jgi:DNA replication factor Dna2